jgi:hypothetical protein
MLYFLYGGETWTCTKRQESKLQVGEMKFLRVIVEKIRRDRSRKTYIREEFSAEEIRIQIKGSKLRWFEHKIP